MIGIRFDIRLYWNHIGIRLESDWNPITLEPYGIPTWLRLESYCVEYCIGIINGILLEYWDPIGITLQ